MRLPFRPVFLLLLLTGCAAVPRAGAEIRAITPRSRVSLDRDWRFHRGDPAGTHAPLLYDVRAEAVRANDEGPADAQAKEGPARKPAAAGVLKPWILPTGNAFIADPARRFATPAEPWRGEVACLRADFPDSGWERVDLPHDWAIAGPFLADGPYGGMGRLPSWGVGWYRRKLDLPAQDAGKRVSLEIDGAMAYAAVWLNGHLVGGWPYGYTSWQVDLTPYVAFGGVNQLAIRLDNPPDSSRWYPGGGLYRHVWLTTTNPVHLARWGTRVTTRDVSPDAATVDVESTLENALDVPVVVRARTRLHPLDVATGLPGGVVATADAAEVTIPAHGRVTVEASTVVRNPRRWGPPPHQQPNRYVAVTAVTRGEAEVDVAETPFGIRTLRWAADAGLYVNGERVAVHGVNQHHDLGALGAAFNRRAAQRQLEELRAMGCNAIRMSHNPPAPELLELTDAMGFLVFDEAFDCWYRGKTPNDFHLTFGDWHEQDLRAMVRRDRNHPSVVLWSVGNEVGEQYTGADGAAVARDLVAIVHAEDPTRPVTSAMNYAGPEMPLPAALDVISLNYQGEGIRDTPEFAGTDRIRKPPQYDAFHATFPGKVILSSESASAFSSRGIYLFPVTPDLSSPVRDGRGGDAKRHQVSAYELYAVDFGSSADKVFGVIDRHPFVAGEFVWTGWDYLGEPTPYYSSRSSYSGIIDLAGFPKDRFYLYQARWRPDLPMVHVLPHWTWPERVGQVTPVHVFTSGDAAELFLNGRSLGRKTKGPFEYRLRWDDVVYAPGVLEVVAYKAGREWARETVRTAGTPAKVLLAADRAAIRGDGQDLAFVTAQVVDANGVLAPRADNRIRFTVQGPGEIVATDNGDATDLEAFPAHDRKAFNGLCLAIVRTKPGARSEITVTATGDGLTPAKVVLTPQP